MSGRPFGVEVYDPVLTELFREDRLSLLALQHALRSRRTEYAYLEIGSHLGGSLQPFLRDAGCRAAYSIDPRPLSQADARGVSFHYPENSTARMLETLRPAYGDALAKLRTFDLDARDVPPGEIDRRPDLCFIDGEDTDAAAQSDFESCLRLGRPDAVIVFSNLQLIFGGFQRCLELLDARSAPYRAYALPLKLGVIELGPSELWRDPAVHDRLASAAAPLFIAENLAHYRDGILALQRLPGARLARRALLAIGLARGLEPRANPRAGEFSRKSDSALVKPNPSSCLICKTPFEPFISFGRQPVANAFLAPEQFADEFWYELKVGLCPSCKMVQLGEIVDRERMFHEDYAFFSSTSKGMSAHFERFADAVRQRHLAASDPFVVELGSNDGIMLRHFADKGIRHLGVEPSANVADVARAKGIRTVSRFFDEPLAREIAAEDGRADAILGANVMCHIPYLHSVLAGVRELLKPSGVLIFEDPYLGDIVDQASYDQIYDEHAFYFSATSLSNLFAMHELELVDVEAQTVHGGSMRYTVRHKSAGPVSERVRELIRRETAAGLAEHATYVRLRERIEASRAALLAILERAKADGKRVVGYGATSKSTTVTNYCGITSELVEFISDTTPIKQGKFSPGTHIPVRPYQEFVDRPPELALLFAWNHTKEIMEKEAGYVASGGRFIVYVPDVRILP